MGDSSLAFFQLPGCHYIILSGCGRITYRIHVLAVFVSVRVLVHDEVIILEEGAIATV
jgi:hypothetical protein